MKKLLIPFLLLITIIPLIGHTQSTSQICNVSATYIETLSEYDHDILRTAVWTNQAESPLTDLDALRINYQLLMSMRHNLEDLRHDLPLCVQEYNLRHIERISAYQDVIGLLLARQAEDQPNPLLLARISSAQDHARGTEIALNEIRVQVTLES